MTDREEQRTQGVVGQHFYATKPTALTLHMRTNLIYQIWRFVVINLKMIRIIAKSHR